VVVRTESEHERINAGEYTRAFLNILEDFTGEKERLEEVQRAVLNILDDFTAEKVRFGEGQRAALNILDDFAGEKGRLEESQRAMLNLLEDFDVEREKTKAANDELQKLLNALRLAKEAADASYRELESFSYSVSHDLRAPLRSIDGYSKVLLEDYPDKLDEKGKKFLLRISAAAIKMGQLIDDMLNLSRVTRTEMKRERVEMTSIAKKIAQSLVESNPGRQVEFKIADGIVAEGDSHLLTIVLDNLLGNALKFTEKKEQAEIEFGIRPDENEKVYFVRDNGAGLDMTFKEKLFQPFQRLHRPEDFSGTGIGLATVKRIIERHGGRVWIKGEVGKGTAVYFTL
jgi:light-regulated signal transduction histidine kinase (bacteriophytochrome)